MAPVRLKAAAKAAAFHFIASFAVALLSAGLVLLIWFPSPLDEIEGGRQLFLLMVAIDVICGPFLTLLIFSPNKRRRELTRDLSVIVLIQLGALIYGLHTAAAARPVYLAFEADRFQVIRATDFDRSDLKDALPEFRSLSFTGPKILAVQVPTSSDSDYLASIALSLNGLPPYMRPKLWRPYDSSRKSVLAKSRSLEILHESSVKNRNLIDAAVKKTGISLADLRYVPVIGHRASGWIALVAAKDATVVAFAEVDGY